MVEEVHYDEVEKCRHFTKQTSFEIYTTVFEPKEVNFSHDETLESFINQLISQGREMRRQLQEGLLHRVQEGPDEREGDRVQPELREELRGGGGGDLHH